MWLNESNRYTESILSKSSRETHSFQVKMEHSLRWWHARLQNKPQATKAWVATRDYHTKWSQSERGTQISYAITYMWNLKYGTSEPFTKQKQTRRHREHPCGCQRGEREGNGWTGTLELVDASYYIQNR